MAITEKIIRNQTLNLQIFPDTFSSQANQAGSSSTMEALGHRKAM